MLRKGIFRKPDNALEGQGRFDAAVSPSVPDKLYVHCGACRAMIPSEALTENAHVCPKCGYYFRMTARQRVDRLLDPDSFREADTHLRSTDPLDFPGYAEKLRAAALDSGEPEAVITGEGRVNGRPCCVFAMESRFMMGSMGSVVGEKITLLFERAAKTKLPVVGFAVSGGARMHEGILSLMQMAKTSGAVKRHSDAGGLYIAILTDPTTGGVTASFAMEADIILAEPKALIAFAGPRVIEQTMKQKLPQGFQRAEFLLENGFIDAVVERNAIRETVSALLSLHGEVCP